MKTKFFLIVILCLAAIANCSKVQLFELSNSNASLEKNYYVYEDFRLSVYYDFWQESGQINFYIYNKLDHPIFIDWQKSYFKFNDIKYYYSGYSFADNLKMENIVYPNQVNNLTRIQPKTHIKNPAIKTAPFLNNFSFMNSDRLEEQKTGATKYEKVDVLTKKFNFKNAPVNYLNFLTFYIADKSSAFLIREFTIINNFRIDSAKLMTEEQFMGSYYSREKQNNFDLSPYRAANRFFIIPNRK